jgi:hypothetical protein
MRGQRYRIKTPALAFTAHDAQKTPASSTDNSSFTTIPVGAEIEVVGPVDGNRLLGVRWEGKSVMMFTNDIRERGERIDGAGS